MDTSRVGWAAILDNIYTMLCRGQSGSIQDAYSTFFFFCTLPIRQACCDTVSRAMIDSRNRVITLTFILFKSHYTLLFKLYDAEINSTQIIVFL